ncbi:hypothetical protein SAMN02910340_02674 [Methanosarcina thermophila]|jgi:hypothetical protein|uniref:Uncharacterized protein n=1 Tax=Methanosarcina thermophila TaxID=2210 RepID=A0A1I7BAJ0_METTE|nr:hypothetical protein [Methanosarcina thermophila]SFT84230.1 hypothetical protein SAMN02910340_02674 [Methanosarcina thermophila]HOA70191.1 hypothetical protein [Methanosarcina thermophila]HOQ66928.1 hypothetical protein [Methanosarcina thermophila]HPT82123.1 hypothetical protein [Methanosarcina thermophila]HPZ21336.1 hypothetical protein [Methanosarcina thermophila]
MRRTMFKTICVITLVFFVMSMTGAAAACSSCSKCKVKTDAVNDKFTINCKSKSYCNNVLKNDKGCNLKVVKPGCYDTKLGGKICIQSNGKFCYTKPAKCTKACTDSFKYCIKGKDGRTDCATITFNINCDSCSKCTSVCAKNPTGSACKSCKC